MSPEMARARVVVEGRVQGVGFRYFVAEQAQEFGIKGWVRNRWDDSVEITAEARKPALERFLERVRRGPRSAFVSDVKVEWSPATGEFIAFSVRPTV